MTREAIEDVIDYIFQNMSVLAGDLTRLEVELHTVLARESVKTVPAVNRVFSGYVSTITRYATVMTEVSKMLGAIVEERDVNTHPEQHPLKQ